MQFQHVATRARGADTHLTAISDLLYVPGSAGGGTLYVASQATGGVLGLDPARGLAITGQDGGARGGASGRLDAPRDLVLTGLQDRPLLLTAGRYGLDIEARWLTDAGALSAASVLRLSGTSGVITETAGFETVQGTHMLVTARRDEGGLTLWRIDGDLRPEPVASGPEAGTTGAGDVADLAHLRVGGRDMVLALSTSGAALTGFWVTPGGGLDLAQRLDTRDGLFVSTPTKLATATVAGQPFVLVGAAGSGTVSAVAVLPDGRLRLTDTVGDDRATRFGGLSVLDTVTVQGQTYVVAGGADDGITLMTLLPGGRLVHLGTLADGAGVALADPAALELAVTGQGAGTTLQIFVAGDMDAGESPTGAGVTQLHVPLGRIGLTLAGGQDGVSLTGTDGRDQLSGGLGNDTLTGGAGDDILWDGAGRDILRGGDGADLFIFGRDGETDIVLDFEPGIDRLDLSGMGRFYTMDAVDIRMTATGGEITVAGETLRVLTRDLTPLRAADLDAGDVLDLWHIATQALPAGNLRLHGTEAADLIEGREGNDTLAGGRAGDVLRGLEGDDLLLGEGDRDDFDMTCGQVVRLYQATLDRLPDLPGLYHWTARLAQAGYGLADAAAGFVGSAEFQRTYGATGDVGFVTLLYRNVLGRAPDADGLAHWTGKLARGELTRAEIVTGFSESGEFRSATLSTVLKYSFSALQAAQVDDVFRLYQATLGRAPDLGGLEHWSGQLAGGQTFGAVTAGFTGSREFQARYGETGVPRFVELLYRNVLGRDPDEAGMAHWTARLTRDGWSRERVVEAFAQSREFVAASFEATVDFLRGAGLDDTLDGGAGRNLLQGGMLSDCFVFRADTPGQYVVTDLEPWDMLRFEGFGFADAEAALRHFSQSGDDLLFRHAAIEVYFEDRTLQDIRPEQFDL